MDWVPKPTFLSTDLPSNLSTSPCPGLSRASARCGLTGTGAHPLAEGRENSGWNRPSLCFLFDESEPPWDLASWSEHRLLGEDHPTLPGSVLSF